jgi:hypothetical protein
MKHIGGYYSTPKKVGEMDHTGPKIGEMAKRADDNKKMIFASANLEKMMKK